MLNTNCFNRTQYPRKKFWILNFIGSDRSNAFRFGSDRSGHEQWRHSPLFTLQNSGEQPKRRRRGRGRAARRWWIEGRWKHRRPVTLHYSHAKWTVESSPNEGEGEGEGEEQRDGDGLRDGGNVVEKGEGGGDSEGEGEREGEEQCGGGNGGGQWWKGATLHWWTAVLLFLLCFCSSPSLYLAVSCLQK